MSSIRKELVYTALKEADALSDINIYHDLTKMHEFRQNTILADKSLNEEEKSYAITILIKEYDFDKIIYNVGPKRICENCHLECLATSYCEQCIRNYLKSNFLNWTSENDIIDNIIQKCQMETLSPEYVVEWIPYNNLENIKYLTKGGYSEIYTADWIDGKYIEWDSEQQLLKRDRTHKVVLKRLDNIEDTNKSWYDEVVSHLTISNKWSSIVHCFGLTREPSKGDYMLVMEQLDTNLRNYLKQNYNKLTWNDKIKIAYDIIVALYYVHKEESIHRDLHSGNILYSQNNDYWYISDLGFCGPVNKPLGAVYGNLPYIAPEVIIGKEYSYASDIYGIGMLMWEISSGQPPFTNLDYDYNLAMNIVDGMRPMIVSEIPLEYKELMEQCWNAYPKERPDIKILKNKIDYIKKSYYHNETKNIVKDNIIKPNTDSNKIYTSQVYEFKNFPEPRNAAEEEQKEFHSRYSFNIPENIDDFNNSDKIIELYKELNLNNANNSNNDIQIDSERETMQQIKKINIKINDDEDAYDDANLHSEEQDELQISEFD
uniref:Protein kinase domain-containing protein n=1 Tax=Rhizophagus irregularis (strain DAOM 181602 / DAOM 197198 / MUCL 43194) TaxID=747089 RepID=U9UGP5_RHIID